MRPMKWCQPCRSYHVDPKTKGEWAVLRCFRPWANWLRIIKREKDKAERQAHPEHLRDWQDIAQGYKEGASQ